MNYPAEQALDPALICNPAASGGVNNNHNKSMMQFKAATLI